MWEINGKKYDLKEFIDKHPGGKYYIKKTENIGDISALFEIYHSFLDKNFLEKELEKYEIKNNINEIESRFNFDNYNELIIEIKKNIDIKSIKINRFYIIRSLIIVILYVYFFISAFFFVKNVYIKIIYSFLAGMLWISNISLMHESQHYSLSKNEFINNIIFRFWNNWSLWNSDIWFLHHTAHHQFTGIINKDPDLYHFRPFAIKTKEDKNYNKFTRKYQHYLISFIMIIFPGSFVGQGISYLRGYLKKKLWGVKLINVEYNFYDIIIMSIYLYVLYKGLLISTLVYLLSCNLFIHLYVAPAHDSFETGIENNYQGNDWFKMQISNSSNYSTNSFIITHLSGGLNYNTEHHLFPNICYVHYPMISKIVKDFCKKKNIKYNEHNNIIDAYRSFLKLMHYFSHKN